MDNKKKLKIILLAIIAIVIISLIVIFINRNQSKNEGTLPREKTVTLDISEVLEIENIEKSKYEKKNNANIEIASRYLVSGNTYELKANIKFMDKVGKVVYVRGDNEKINVYQTEYKLDKYESINSQVEKIINEFEEMCKSYLIGLEEDPKEERLYGEASQKGEIPLGESIYYDNRLYSKTYEKESKTYDINFYRSGEKIICEFVYNLEEK